VESKLICKLFVTLVILFLFQSSSGMYVKKRQNNLENHQKKVKLLN